MSSVFDSLVRLAPRSSCHTTSLVSLWMSGVGTACLVVCEICSIYIPDWILSPLAEAISKPGVRFSSSPTQASNSVQSFSATTANGSNCLDQFKVFRCLWNLVSWMRWCSKNQQESYRTFESQRSHCRPAGSRNRPLLGASTRRMGRLRES
jgi:hypothetical protein